MRSIWKGSVSFGLVSIPIRVVSATENHSVSFRQIHTADGGRIRYRKVCELDGEELSGEDIGKGFETGDGATVQLTDADLAALPLPTARTVEILGFVPAADVDPIQLDRSYYLASDGQAAAKPYALLREALKRSGKVAVGKLAMRGRESLALVRVYEGALALHTMLWPDEIRQPAGVAPEGEVTVRDAELDLADALMETLGDLEWDELHDEYREAVERLVVAKLEGAEPGEAGLAAAEPSGKGQVVDLMSVLESSVQAAKESRGEEAGSSGTPGAGAKGGGRGTGKASAASASKSDATVHELSGRRAANKSAKKASAPSSKASGSTKKATEGAGAPDAGAKRGAAKKTSATAKKQASGAKAGGKQAVGKKGAAKEPAAKKTGRSRKSA